MQPDEPLFLGLDVGTGGVRAVAVTQTGTVAGQASVTFEPELLAPQPVGHEQPPTAWWKAVCRVTAALLDSLNGAARGHAPGRLAAVAVDGTSGTLVALDRAGEPLRPAIMYNDPRAAAEAEQINAAAEDFCCKLGYRFKASFTLAKLAWLRNNEPELFANAARFVHQADYVQEQLTGKRAISDYSNALKTGYDLLADRWPAWLGDLLGGDFGKGAARLPRVVAPGRKVGSVSAAAAAQTGLPEALPVVTGATDGTAACLASGVRRPGDYNVTLGTTLVIKGISRRICRHGEGLIYSHKLPGGWWLPGAAGNVGCEWISRLFPGADLPEMDAAAASRLPSECLAYPLVRTGERFPFLSNSARGFFVPEVDDPIQRYAACLQGTALVERLCCRVLDEAAGTSGGAVYSTGGGSRSDVWMQCRADVTGRVMHRGACGESAFGAAVLAAVGTRYAGLAQAIEKMVRIEKSFTPNREHAATYDRLFARFCEQLEKRGYR